MAPKVAKRRCFVIGLGAQTAPEGWTFSELVSQAFADHPEYEVFYDFEYRVRYPMNSQIMDFLKTADLVIADITKENDITMYLVGIREMLGTGPIIFLASDDVRDRVRRLIQNEFIEYDPLKPVGPYRNDLSLAIGAVPQSFKPRYEESVKPKTQARQLAKRVGEIADAIAELRINSVAEHVEQLRSISEELRQQQGVSTEELHAVTKRTISVLAEIDAAISSSKLAKLIVSGALAALVTSGGIGAAAVFSLSMAVWQGPGFFKQAVSKFRGQLPPTKRVASRTSSPTSSAPRVSRRRARPSGGAKGKAE